MPLCLCAIVTMTVAVWGPTAVIEGKQQVRLAFEIVLGCAAAVFLAGFYIDGHWTDADRLGRKIIRAAGGDENSPAGWARFGSNRNALRQNAEVALASIRASADALTLMGAAIGLIAIVTAAMGLPTVHAVQILLLGLAYQLFVVSRHPYYIQLAEAALAGELLPKEDEGAGKSGKRA
ncbi:MAG: hypothetical protein AB7Y46_19275 [Armatimonadota bacterium]